METQILLFKIIMTPIIIAGVTLIARRWGNDIGGLFIGLPLTSGPVSIFFSVEQGRQFAAHAANSAMLGTIPVVIFYLTYMFCAKRFPWYLSSIFSIIMYFLAVFGFSQAAPIPVITAFLVPLFFGIGLFSLGKTDMNNKKMTYPWWDIPFRVITATFMVVFITTAARNLGPVWSGLLSAFPVFTIVIVTFSHRQGGSAAIKQYFRGAILGLYSYYLFFMVVMLLIEKMSISLVYSIASVMALLLNLLFLTLRIRKKQKFFATIPPSGT